MAKIPKPTKPETEVKFECLTGHYFSYGTEFTPTGVIRDKRLIEKARNNPDFKEVTK